MAATTTIDPTRRQQIEQIAAQRPSVLATQSPPNQYTGAPPAPAAPPATVAGLGMEGQIAPGAQAATPAAALAAASPAAAPKPTVPTAILATQRGSSWSGSGPDPRGPDYYADIAKLNSDTNIAETNLDLEQAQRQSAHDVAKEQISHSNDLNIRATRENNARSGLGTSTQGGNAIGEVEYNFATQNAANEAELTNWLQAAAISRLALEQGYTVDEASALAAAVYRKSLTDAPLPETPAPAAAPGAPASNATNPVFQTGGPQPAGNKVWDASRSQWVNTGPSPGADYQFNPTTRAWVHTGPAPGKGYKWSFAKNKWYKGS